LGKGLNFSDFYNIPNGRRGEGMLGKNNLILVKTA
jgi:hypothetical protein